MGRFIKNDVLANKTAKKLSEINLDDVNNRLSYKEVEIGEETRRAISKFSSEQQRKFELGAVSFLVASTKHLVKRPSLHSKKCKIIEARCS